MNNGYGFYPYFINMPNLTRAASMPPLRSAAPITRGLGSIFSSLRAPSSLNGATIATKTPLTFSTILNGASKTLNVINQALPIINQARPLINNAKTMLKVVKSINSVDSNQTNNTTTPSPKEQPQEKKIEKIIENDNSPNFFI